MTAFEALRLTRGQWHRNSKGEVVCPVCGVAIFWADYARTRHLTAHLRAGWSPVQAPGTSPHEQNREAHQEVGARGV